MWSNYFSYWFEHRLLLLKVAGVCRKAVHIYTHIHIYIYNMLTVLQATHSQSAPARGGTVKYVQLQAEPGSTRTTAEAPANRKLVANRIANTALCQMLFVVS